MVAFGNDIKPHTPPLSEEVESAVVTGRTNGLVFMIHTQPSDVVGQWPEIGAVILCRRTI